MEISGTLVSLNKSEVLNRLRYPKFIDLLKEEEERRLMKCVTEFGSISKRDAVQYAIEQAASQKLGKAKLGRAFDGMVKSGYLKRSTHDLVSKPVRTEKRREQKASRKSKPKKAGLDKGLLAMVGRIDAGH